jgi:steroid delta-isomerase-like uncharacterized protein
LRVSCHRKFPGIDPRFFQKHLSNTLKGDTAMETDREKQAKNLFAAIDARDLEGFLSFHTDDVIVTMADGTVLRGKEALRDYFKNTFAAISDIKADLTSFFSSGDHQCEEYILSGKHTGDFMGIPATGKSFSYRIVAVKTLRGDKISHVSSYSDSAFLMRQLGVLPPTPQR